MDAGQTGMTQSDPYDPIEKKSHGLPMETSKALIVKFEALQDH
jgi:hypothetical protein